MALIAQAEPEHTSTIHHEGFLHYLAREGRTALRWCIGICMVGIVMVMVSPGFYFVAIVPAAVMVACVILLVVANAIESRSDKQAHEVMAHHETAAEDDLVNDMANADQLAPDTASVIKRETAWAIVIVGVAVLAALFVAYWFLPLKLFAIGALVVFAYMLLLAAPTLLGVFNDDIESTTERLEDRPQDEPQPET
jgi:hypothetical protein